MIARISRIRMKMSELKQNNFIILFRVKHDLAKMSDIRIYRELFNTVLDLQSNLNSSNTDDSFTMANSNSFLSPYEVLPIAQENKYLRIFSNFFTTLYVMCTH